MRSASIRTKILVALVLGLVAIAVMTAIVSRFAHERAVGRAVRHEVETAARILEQLEALEIDRLSSLAEVLTADERLSARFEARDREGVLSVARPLFETLRAGHGVTHWYFHPPSPARDGVFLRVHRPALAGDRVLRPLVLAAVAEGRRSSGVELGRTAYALRVVEPWRRDGKLLGFLELGQDVPTFLRRLRAMTGDDCAMVLAKARLDREAWSAVEAVARDWDERAELVAVEALGERAELLRGLERLADVPDAPEVLGERHVDGRELARGIFPVRDERGEKIGAVVVVHDVTALHAGAGQVRARVVLLVGFLAVALAALVVFMLEALVFERLSRMARALEALPERLARGDLDLGEELGPRADDEIGRFEAFFARAMREVGSFVADVRRERPPEPRRRAGPDDFV